MVKKPHINLVFSVHSEGTSFPLADANGNCVSFIDEAGNVQAHYTYDAFGNTVSQTGAMAADFRFRFSSKYLDDETGLYYYGYRYLSPALGRWVKRDPFEEIGGVNLYLFVDNSSVSKLDIHGLGVWDFNVDYSQPEYPSVDVTYTLDADERVCCEAAVVDRYVRNILGLPTGAFGSYSLDHSPGILGGGYSDAMDKQKGHAEGDAPEGPGIGNPFTQEVLYRFPWTMEFMFKARCTAGPWAGKILSTTERYFEIEGHREGEPFKYSIYSLQDMVNAQQYQQPILIMPIL